MDITVRNLRKTYRGGVTALDAVDLDITTGMFGLLGQNGAGKTTLMRVLAGILRPTTGSVTVGSHDLATESGRVAVKRTLGYLPQELGLYPDLTAAEFLDYIAVLKGSDDRSARRQRTRAPLDEVGLARVAGRKLKKLSGGMKQRVGIAQALLNDPRTAHRRRAHGRARPRRTHPVPHPARPARWRSHRAAVHPHRRRHRPDLAVASRCSPMAACASGEPSPT